MPGENNLALWLKELERGPGRTEKERLGQPGGSAGMYGGGVPFTPGPSMPSESDSRIAPDQLAEIIAAIYRQRDVFILPFNAGLVPFQLRPAENRKYVFVQNQSAANNLALGINGPPGPLTGNPVNGLVIVSNFGFYEPLVVPQGELWIVASAANTPGVLLYSA